MSYCKYSGMEKWVILNLVFAIAIDKCHLKETVVDQNGYIMYCPCMGRFGNQADQFLGSIAFAKALDRTLILPPWVSYPSSTPGSSDQIPFNKWFKINPLKKYHKVITMEKFMKELASDVWPVGKRKGFCYMFMQGKDNCSMKDGNPFGPFWNKFGVEFDEDVRHEDLLWSTQLSNAYRWNQRFPASEFPVLAFKGSPGNFPSLAEHQFIQKYLHFSKRIETIADEFISNEMKGHRYLAIHLRNGVDMTRVCDEVNTNKYKTLFSSTQCTDLEGGPQLTNDLCNPPKTEIISKVLHYIEEMKLKALYVATDNDSMIRDFKKAFKKIKFPVHIYQFENGGNEYDGPIIDIAIMSKADMFIGNCISSFSAFVRRQRLSRAKPLSFFGVDSNNPIHTEL